MKRLLFVISQLYSGGAERSLVNLLKNLPSDEYDVDLLILNQECADEERSLISEVPSWVNICDAFAEIQSGINIVNRIKGKLYYNAKQTQQYYISALNFVYGKCYDWAFHIGEWHSPEFVANEVIAKHKGLWSHTDLDAARYIGESFFQYSDCFDRYIFVSRSSLEASCRKYPFLRKKALVIHNMNDVCDIRLKAIQKLENIPNEKSLTVVTVANIRPEKNHMRQLKVMKKLKEQGVDFCWWNIGSLTNETLCKQIKETIQKYGLEKKFVLLGAQENPYPFIKNADIVACLSDYESWSMVITEAKILGKPIVATRTSGATEQIIDGHTGFLTDFTVENISQTLSNVLKDANLRKRVSENLKSYDDTPQIILEFKDLVNNELKQNNRDRNILYIIDDVNYQGGAHGATVNQIKSLIRQGKQVDIFSGTSPCVQVRNELDQVDFFSWQDIIENQLYHERLFNCVLNTARSKGEKKYKLKMSSHAKKNSHFDIFNEYVKPKVANLFSKYEIVCIMSEGSNYKKEVALSNAQKKIQWIHTDYCAWQDQTEYGRLQSQHDGEYWENFDTIVVLAESIKKKLVARMPFLEEKIKVVPNVMPIEKIRSLSERKKKKWPKVKFITVCRFEAVKEIPRLLRVLKRLYEEGYDFQWTFIGNGDELQWCMDFVNMNGLNHVIEFMGKQDNPYIFIKQADVFGLFSNYEGLPNTIYEALILGVPVCATNVGGVKDQVIPYETGWLAENDEKDIFSTLVYIMEHPNEVKQIKEKLIDYQYDNQNIEKLVNKIFTD